MIYTIFQKQKQDFKIKNKDKKYSIIVFFLLKDEAENGRNQGNLRGLKLPHSFHVFFLFMAAIMHGGTNCEKYKSS